MSHKHELELSFEIICWKKGTTIVQKGTAIVQKSRARV